MAAGLVSCSGLTRERSGAELRKEGYDMLVKTVKPGMYRRQLYAVLPPFKKPMAKPAQQWGVAGLLTYTPHQEVHELDEECRLVIDYQLKNGGEYKDPREKNWGRDPRTIDELMDMFASIAASRVPPKQNPDDIITSISEVLLKAEPSPPPNYGGTVSPTQEHGVLFGREPAAGPLPPPRPISPFPPDQKPSPISRRPPGLQL